MTLQIKINKKNFNQFCLQNFKFRLNRNYIEIRIHDIILKNNFNKY